MRKPHQITVDQVADYEGSVLVALSAGGQGVKHLYVRVIGLQAFYAVDAGGEPLLRTNDAKAAVQLYNELP